MERIAIKGVPIAYYDLQAEGATQRPVLVMHGFPGTAVGHMHVVIEALRQDRRVIAPDLRGYGASRPPQRDFPVDFYQRDADDMAALLDALGLRDLFVVGYSDGAESALLLASRRPDLVHAVFAWGACGIASEQQEEQCKTLLPVAEWGESRAAWRAEIVAIQGEEALESLITGWVGGVNAIIAERERDVSLSAASAIRCPVLLLNGAEERGNPPEAAKALVARIPKGELRFVPASGHAIQDDQPLVLLEAIQAFFAEHEG